MTKEEAKKLKSGDYLKAKSDGKINVLLKIETVGDKNWEHFWAKDEPYLVVEGRAFWGHEAYEIPTPLEIQLHKWKNRNEI